MELLITLYIKNTVETERADTRPTSLGPSD